MPDEQTRFDRDARRARPDRHCPQLHPQPAPPPAPAAETPPRRAAPAPAPLTQSPAIHDQTPGALRRPAHISERCAGCGAPTRGRAGMVTELVDAGPVRGLRVVECSACPDRRRRDIIV